MSPCHFLHGSTFFRHMFRHLFNNAKPENLRSLITVNSLSVRPPFCVSTLSPSSCHCGFWCKSCRRLVWHSLNVHVKMRKCKCKENLSLYWPAEETSQCRALGVQWESLMTGLGVFLVSMCLVQGLCTGGLVGWDLAPCVASPSCFPSFSVALLG